MPFLRFKKIYMFYMRFISYLSFWTPTDMPVQSRQINFWKIVSLDIYKLDKTQPFSSNLTYSIVLLHHIYLYKKENIYIYVYMFGPLVKRRLIEKWVFIEFYLFLPFPSFISWGEILRYTIRKNSPFQSNLSYGHVLSYHNNL